MVAPEPRTMCHAAVLDAGSSGTRIYVYGWKSWREGDSSPPQIEEVVSVKEGPGIAKLIPDAEIATFAARSQADIEAIIRARVEDYLEKIVRNGRSFFSDKYFQDIFRQGRSYFSNEEFKASYSSEPEFEEAREFFRNDDFNEILKAGRGFLSAQYIAKVPLYFLATAGMRHLRDTPRDGQTAAQRRTFYDALLACIKTYMKDKSGFDVKECGSITGEAEALYGWIAANYSLGFFSGFGMRVSQAVGYVELGGASAQIAYHLIKDRDTDPARSLSVAKFGLINAEGAVRFAAKHANGAPNPALNATENKARTIHQARLTLHDDDRSGGLDSYEGRLAKVKIGVLEFDLFLASYAAGTDVAMRKYDTHILGTEPVAGVVQDPSKHKNWSKPAEGDDPKIEGSADFNQVKAIISELQPTFNYPENEKPDANIVRSSNRSFVGGASFWYNTRGVFGLDSHGRPRKNRFSFKQYNNEVKQSFNRDFATAKAYRPTVGVKYLVESGFTAAWVQHVLLQCFGFKGDDPAVTHEDKLSFRPYNGSAEAELSWTLGRVVLLAVGDSKPQQMTGPQARAYNELSAELARRDAVRFGFEEERHAATTDLRGAQKLREVKAIELDMRDSNGLKKKAEEKLAGLRREIRTTTQGDANRFFRLL